MTHVLERLVRPLGLGNWGDWRWLGHPNNIPRYATIEQLRLQHAPDASVLDLGCGSGLVATHLTTDVPYLGIDLHPAAIRVARAHATPARAFVCGDIADRKHVGSRRFGFIVMNEVLYYQPSVPKAVALMQQYEASLELGGLILVSIWLDRRRPGPSFNASILSAVEKAYKGRCLAQVDVPFSELRGWRVGLYRP